MVGSDQATEGIERIPIRFVVRIAERVIGGARVAQQRQVNHLAGIASLERPGDHGFVGSQDRGVDSNSQS